MPAAPVSFTLLRFELAPVASVAYPPGDPGMGGHLVESGALTLRNFSGEIAIARAAHEATPEAETSEVLPAGSETVLAPGEGFLLLPVAAGGFRNDGTELVVLALAVLYPAGAMTDADAESATPTP